MYLTVSVHLLSIYCDYLEEKQFDDASGVLNSGIYELNIVPESPVSILYD